MKIDDFTKEERTIIAEYVYSYNQDILIKGDAKDLIEMMRKKEMVTNQKASELNQKVDTNDIYIVDELLNTLSAYIDNDEGIKIMNEYFGKS